MRCRYFENVLEATSYVRFREQTKNSMDPSRSTGARSYHIPRSGPLTKARLINFRFVGCGLGLWSPSMITMLSEKKKKKKQYSSPTLESLKNEAARFCYGRQSFPCVEILIKYLSVQLDLKAFLGVV